jgi:hypothetical protein
MKRLTLWTACGLVGLLFLFPVHRLMAEGGENCSDPMAISALPYMDTGYTCDNSNDYDVACSDSGTSPDVVYRFTPASDMSVTCTLCGSTYNTKLYVWENACPGADWLCDDDGCSPPNYPDASIITGIQVVGGNTYYIVVDGGGSYECGDYSLYCFEGLPSNQPPVCNADGPYDGDCAHPVMLDGSASYDPDGDPITFLWATDCPGGNFDDPTSEYPMLDLSGIVSFPYTCGVYLTATDDKGAVGTCEAETIVTCPDRKEPQPPEKLTVEKDQPKEHSFIATDTRSGETVKLFYDPDTLELLKVEPYEDEAADEFSDELGDGEDEQDDTVIIDGNGEGEKTASSIEYPENLKVRIHLKYQPIHNYFTRYITFTNWNNQVRRVALAFKPYTGYWSNYWYEGLPTATGMSVLRSLADTGRRWYWDAMKFENRGGSTPLPLSYFKLWVEYDLNSNYEEDILVVNSVMSQTLDAGFDSVSLNSVAQTGRRVFAGFNSTQYATLPSCLKLAIQDLGKSGSDGRHYIWEFNPKYNSDKTMLCSEFVSWYFHEGGEKLILWGFFQFDFRDVTGTQTMHDAFKRAGKLYCYDAHDHRFEHTSTGAVYQPKPGDFLERRKKNGAAEHSMMMLDWDQASKTAYVINGPWPVTIRFVDVDALEQNDKDFCVGRID